MKALRGAALSLLLLGCRRAPDARDTGPVAPEATLTFRVDGRTVRSLSLGALAARLGVETITNLDPYYGRVKSFRAIPLAGVLREGFAGAVAGSLRARMYVLRAQDGYTVPLAGARLLEGGAYLAVRDVEAPRWQPIGPQQASPGPAYLIWQRADQTSLETHPRPWQLASLEITRFETAFPHTAPEGEAPDGPAWRGYALFGDLCIRCHAINRAGGRVGPELNVPQNITAYRPEAQIRAYIRDPRTFRYGNMPAHPQLTEAHLDDLLAYLRAMATRPHDPDAAAPPHGAAPP